MIGRTETIDVFAPDLKMVAGPERRDWKQYWVACF